MYDDDGDDDDACFGEVGTVSWSSSMFAATEKSFDISQIYYMGVFSNLFVCCFWVIGTNPCQYLRE